METFGVAAIIVALLLGRQVSVGRASNVGQDTKDFLTSLLAGDTGKIKEISQRRGQNIPNPPATTASPVSDSALAGSQNGTALISEMHRLASAAGNKYVYGATGPGAYDCSGLVWRALENLGVYKGVRFVTETFGKVAESAGFAHKVGAPAVGDVVLWPQHHMGVYVATDKMYSALNHREGILESSISGFGQGTPEYWRLVDGPAFHTQN